MSVNGAEATAHPIALRLPPEPSSMMAVTKTQNGKSNAPEAIDHKRGTCPKTICARQMVTDSVPKNRYKTGGALKARSPANKNAKSVVRARIAEMPHRCGTEYVPF